MPKQKTKKPKKAVANEKRRKRSAVSSPKRPTARAPRKRKQKPVSHAKRRGKTEKTRQPRRSNSGQYERAIAAALRLRELLKAETRENRRDASPAKRLARELANAKVERFIAETRLLGLQLKNAEKAREAATETAARIREQYERKAAREERRRRAAFDESAEVQEILERQDDESIDDYLDRVKPAMSLRGFHHDAWYAVGAEQFGFTEKDFYSTIMGSPPKLGV